MACFALKTSQKIHGVWSRNFLLMTKLAIDIRTSLHQATLAIFMKKS